MPGSLILFGVVIYLLFFTFMAFFLGRAVLAEHRQQVALEAEAQWQVKAPPNNKGKNENVSIKTRRTPITST
ncbi:hypothetical protein SAMN05444487_112100 [Marininema mesophilum]|uniref:Uncharacterized protein n=1 Tax=Marininema mesophilum TaxID=1048340 RepID=A0A1H3A3H8_9BACL|nr:hypothetical protein [Marininema mesophilum]SDX23768.1 hypothetical protein SAMN05444487_112100 [Marininema mesophilum]